MQKTGQLLFLFERDLDDYLGLKVLLPYLLSALSPMMFPTYCHMCPIHVLLQFIHTLYQILFKVLSIVPMCPHILPHSITFYHIFLALKSRSLSLHRWANEKSASIPSWECPKSAKNQNICFKALDFGHSQDRMNH
jgi:hypothetical protein